MQYKNDLISDSQGLMKSEGFYDRYSYIQREVIALGIPLLKDACQQIDLSGVKKDFVIADYGCATGGNSIALMKSAIQEIRHRVSNKMPVTVIHTDQVRNDYSSLFKLLHESEGSYIRNFENVYSYAIGRSFYEQLIPEQQVNIGWTSSSAQWLSRIPGPLNGYCWYRRSMESMAPYFAEQARLDWSAFLQYRINELVTGGYLIAMLRCDDENDKCGLDQMFDRSNSILQNMIDSHVLQASEFERMVFPLYYRNMDEIRSPLESGPIASLIELNYCEMIVPPNPIWAQYQNDNDVSRFATESVNWYRAFSEGTILGVLNSNRSRDERKGIINDFYSELRRAVIANPSIANAQWNTAMISIKKL